MVAERRKQEDVERTLTRTESLGELRPKHPPPPAPLEEETGIGSCLASKYCYHDICPVSGFSTILAILFNLLQAMSPT